MSKVKKIVIVFFTAVVLSLSSAVSVFATNYFYMPTSFVQPTSSSCYLEVVCANWTMCIQVGLSDDNFIEGDTDINATTYTFIAIVDGSNNLKIYPYTYEGTSGYNPVSNINIYGFAYTSDNCVPMYAGTGYVYFPLANSGAVKGIHGYNCNTSTIVARSDYLTSDFTIVYGNDKLQNQKLDEIKSAIQSQAGDVNTITSNADKNASNIQSNADKNASAIQSNNDKNTQSIIDNQNQLAEQEKTETQNSGNDSVSDVSSSVPDKSAGMLSALQSLSNAVSYTGTTAKWTFPQMYIPAISGVTDRINLNTEMEIDFTYWVNQIPQDIRTVISAVATIGLVIFAFKELYGLISYVLTLKGGGNNE